MKGKGGRIKEGREEETLLTQASFPPTRIPHCLLRQLGLPLRGVWALTSSELPRAVPDGPT
jgi:hypothetical protein